MDPQRFPSDTYGRVEKSNEGFYFYLPKPLPRGLQFSSDTVLALSGADAALGRLSGVARLLREPAMLVDPYVAREALASSKIEGTQASLDEIFQASASGEDTEDEDIREVTNYTDALNAGRQYVDSGGRIGRSLILSLHRILLQELRGKEGIRGRLRSSTVWIGSATDSADTAAFVPPLPEQVEGLLADLEDFLERPPRLPALVRCAMMHYQFESIHPFVDGNGRVGRLLIVLMILQEGLLPLPLLYVSAYMEANRRQYYERLQAVREVGDMQQWLQYFLTAVERQATDAEARAERLVSLRERYRIELRGTRSRALEVVDLLFSNPFITVRRVERELGVTNQGARNLIESLCERGWLERLKSTGRGGRVYWLGRDVHHALRETS